jgi:threonine dehydratase
MKNKVTVKTIEKAYERLKGVATLTPLELNRDLSEKYNARVYLKREDLQPVRSYKLRGAYNYVSSLTAAKRKKGIVCASAGNHAQGVAFSCMHLRIWGTIYMPLNTPQQKVDRVRSLGGKWIELKLVGNTFDESCHEAKLYCMKTGKTFVHPFDDSVVISGQGTVGLEILHQLQEKIDYVLLPVGGGGLVSGVGVYFKEKSKHTTVVGVEPSGAPSMKKSLEAKKIITLDTLDTFVDGAAVRTVGDVTFALAQEVIDQIVLVDEGRVCTEMISLYQNNGIVAEPAGALSVAALDSMKKEIAGKTVVCVVSGGNNDLGRYPEVIKRSNSHQLNARV